MTLINELLNALNEEGEPLQKRLRIADYAFTSCNIHLQSKETYLLNWITSIANSNSDAWKLYHHWLNSTQFKNLTKSDLSQDCIKKIYEVVWEKLSDSDYDARVIAIDSSLLLINSTICHEYFKLNLKNYFSFLCKLVQVASDKHTVLKILKNENIFNKIYYASDKFYKYFFDLLLPVLSEIEIKYKDNDIFLEICSLVQKCILRKNFKQCEDYLQQLNEGVTNAKYSVLKCFFASFVNRYNTSTEICPKMLRIFLHSICSEYSNSPLLIYKLSIILFQIIGFDLSKKFSLHIPEQLITAKSLNKSLTIAVVIFHVLSTYKIELDLKIVDVTFSEFIRTLLLTIINITEVPNKLSFKIIYYCVDLDPLVIDSIITEILHYLLLRKNDCKIEYIQLLTVIFKVFVKLHRIQNLVSKMFPVLKQLLKIEEATADNAVDFDGDIPPQSIVYEYNTENIFPPEILSCFNDCITHLASWQVMNLFKTFLHHLTISIDDVQNIMDDEHKLIYIESIGIFLCQFLSSVRIAEHTVPDLALNKFVKAMDELKLILSKFGNILITMKHNHALMRTFLSICCKWGDLYMILSYYSTSVDMSLAEIRKQDHCLSNISYIHPYLTAAQWSLISERVKNFGKTTCQALMQDLFIQHIKAVLLFENTLNEGMVLTLISNFMLSLSDLWYCIIEDSFVLNNVVSKMHSSQIHALADVVINNISVSGDINKVLPKIINSETMVKYLVYTLLMKINKAMKTRKTSGARPISIKMFDEFYEILNLDDEDYNLVEKLLMKLNEEPVTNEHHSDVVKINHEKLCEYLKMLTAVPIIYTTDSFRTCTGLYLLAILNDLRYFDKGNAQNSDYLEMLLAGILRTTPKRFANSMEPKTVIHYLVDNVNNYKKIFTYFTETLYLQENVMEQIENISNFLMENITYSAKYIDCIVILLTSMVQHKKGKLTPEHKNKITLGVLRISTELTNLLTSKKVQSLILYALTLKITLSQNGDITQLKQHLEYYTEIALSTVTEEANNEGDILLLSAILHNKSTFEIVKDDFILKIWNKYKDAKVPKELFEEREKLMVLVFEHVDNENFKDLTKDLVTSTEMSRYSKDECMFVNYIDLWNGIVQCNFNQTKGNTWTQALLSLLQNCLVTLNDNDTLVRKKIIEFQIHVTQTVRIHLTSPIVDTMLLTISMCVKLDSLEIDRLCLKLLDVLLRYRKPLVTDMIPSFLQQYRLLLQSICKRSNSTLPVANSEDLEKSGHYLEMLTKNFVTYGKHVARITPYIIADILKQYETIHVIPEVKIHLDNCIYSLLELCDQHAISYLMRTSSTASTEIFKFIYENYNKYYRYKGKV